MHIDPRPWSWIVPSSTTVAPALARSGPGARGGPPLAVAPDEGGRRLLGVVVVPDRDVPAPGDPPDPLRPGGHDLQPLGIDHPGLVVVAGELPATEVAGLRTGLGGPVPVVDDGVGEHGGELRLPRLGEGDGARAEAEDARAVVALGVPAGEVLVDQGPGDGVTDDRDDVGAVVGDEA